MRESTKFGIKANVGFFIFYLIAALVAGFVFSLFGFNVPDNIVANGLFVLILQFVVMYGVVYLMLKDLKIAQNERKASLKATFNVYVIVTVVFMLMSYRQTFGSGILWFIFLLLGFPVGYLAIEAVATRWSPSKVRP